MRYAAGQCLDYVLKSLRFSHKYFFPSKGLRDRQLAFVTYQLFITGLTLWIISQLRCSDFVVKRISIYRNFQLVTPTSTQVVLANLSLACSSVVRLLRTPAIALLSFLLYPATIPGTSIILLINLYRSVGIVFLFRFSFDD